MYKLTTDSNKRFNKACRATQFHNLENKVTRRDLQKDDDNCQMSSPKPVFNYSNRHPHQMNGSRAADYVHPPNPSLENPQHDELVNFIRGPWDKTYKELAQADHASSNNQHETESPVIYREKQKNPELDNFKPFDYLEFKKKRILENAKVPVVNK